MDRRHYDDHLGQNKKSGQPTQPPPVDLDSASQDRAVGDIFSGFNPEDKEQRKRDVQELSSSGLSFLQSERYAVVAYEHQLQESLEPLRVASRI